MASNMWEADRNNMVGIMPFPGSGMPDRRNQVGINPPPQPVSDRDNMVSIMPIGPKVPLTPNQGDQVHIMPIGQPKPLTPPVGTPRVPARRNFWGGVDTQQPVANLARRSPVAQQQSDIVRGFAGVNPNFRGQFSRTSQFR